MGQRLAASHCFHSCTPYINTVFTFCQLLFPFCFHCFLWRVSMQGSRVVFLLIDPAREPFLHEIQQQALHYLMPGSNCYHIGYTVWCGCVSCEHMHTKKLIVSNLVTAFFLQSLYSNLENFSFTCYTRYTLRAELHDYIRIHMLH